MLNASHRSSHSGLFVVTSIVLSLLFANAVAGPEDSWEGGQWGPVIDWPHIAVSAANLPDGRILTWSGSERETWPTTEQTYSATWNPSTGEFVEVFHEGHNMFCAHLAMLEDGRVFVNGGRNQTNSPWTSIFDFRDNEWVQIENMQSGGRWYPTTVALADGDIFTAVGTATLQRYPERWNVDSGWEIKNGIDFNDMVLDDYFSSGTHGESRWWPLLHVAPNGQIFHSGPTPKMHYIDPDGNGSYVQAGPEFTDFYHKHGTTIMYDEGKLLTAGGWIAGSDITSTNQAFTVDLNGPSPTIVSTDSMTFSRKFQNGVVLPTGEVLVIGGNTSGRKFSDDGAVLEVEIWNPDTGTWTVGSAMDIPRNYHSIALLLNDGRVLAAGSGYCSGSVTCGGSSHRDGQVYSPPYLFNDDGTAAVRPVIDSAPGRVASAETFTLSGTADLQRFTMIKMGSTTHGVNTDVRFLEVPFSQTSPGVYELTAHSNRNVLTAGYWMLFGIDSNGVPSAAHVVQANTSGNPWLATVPQQSSQEGESVSVEIQAGDADDDPLAYSATGLPGGLTINSATGEITGAATTAGFYDVTVTVDDSDEGTRSRDFSWLVFGQGLGSIRRDWWTGISGSNVSDLTSNSNFPDSPSGSDSLMSFEAPASFANNYGTRIHGYLTPDQSGLFTFWIASDDGGELWLSTDSNPANRQLIANVPGWSGSRQWTKFPEQQSAPIQLEADTTYYIEALHKEGSGGDNLAVGWTRPGESAIEVIPGAYLSPDNIEIDAPVQAKLDYGVINNVGDAWVAVDLEQTYSDMVVVATPSYNTADLPVVTRVRNTAPDQFEVRVQNPGDSAIAANYDVHYMVAEKGVYAGGGAFFEVALIDAESVDSASSWVGSAISYQQPYANPVVVGQVTGDAGNGWSAFWASDGIAANPPNGFSLSVGRHVAQDADTVRAAEQLGYIIFEAGAYQVGSVTVEADIGSDTVRGFGDSPPYNYSLAGVADATILSSAGMNGADGGWPVLYDSTVFPTNQVGLAIDEDQIADAERAHTSEQVAYVALTAVSNEPLAVDPIGTSPQVTGSMINFSLNVTGAVSPQFNWNFGDGSPESGFGPNASIQHNYAAPGRYVISVTVLDPNTLEEQTIQFVQVVHRPLTTSAPTASSTIALNESLSQVWNVNPDNDTVTVITDISTGAAVELPTDQRPTAVQFSPTGSAWVVNRDSATIAVFDASTLVRTLTIELPSASAPTAVAFDHAENVAFVMLEALGDVVKLDAISGAQLGSVYVGDNARHVSVTSDSSKLLVTRFITPTLPDEWTASPIVEFGGQQYGGEVLVVDPFSMTVQSTAILEHSERGVSEHTGPGVPNYLGPAVISPDGTSAWVPSKQDNILAGALRGGPGMTFDQTVRAVSSMIDLSTNLENFTFRVDHDNASVASYAAFGPYGATLYVALEGNREVAVVDVYTATEIFRFDVGRAPQGLVVSDDGDTLYVHNFTDRTIGVYDVSGISSSNSITATEINTIPTVSVEKLSASELNGKRLFYDARDPRLALDSYMSCASCHDDGGQDGRVWDFTGVGEGLRNTITLKGRAAMAHGFLHWSGNFDELQDFEDQIRNFSIGTGLMNDADYLVGSRSTPLGDPKAGLSQDLDDLAAYVQSLDAFENSPNRNADGTLTADGEAGRLLFESEGCESCHTTPRFTDSGAVVLHDVGTIKSSSGNRLGGSLTGLDTPTLLSIWNTAPYLHDGSALDVTEAISAHDSITLTAEQLNQLGAYLEQLDPVTAQIVTPNGAPTIINPGAQFGETGQAVNLTIAASDPDGDTLTYSASGLPAGLLIDATSGQISGTPTESGISSVTVTVSDGTDSASASFSWTVVDPNGIPTITNPGDQSHETGESVNLPIVAADPDSDPLTYSATGLPAGLGIDPASGLISGSLTTAGSSSVTVTVSDGTDSASTSFNWTVVDPNGLPTFTNPGDQSGETGQAVNLTIAASDPDGDTLTYSASGLPAGLLIDATSGQISGTPTESGISSVTVTVSDGTDSASASFSWTVVDPNGIPTITNPGDQSHETGESVNLPIVAADPDSDPLTYSATGLPAGLSIDPPSGVISGTPSTDGSNSVTVTVSDGSDSASASFNWTIATSDGESSTAFDASATPQLLSANDSNGVELGVKFTVDTDGYIAGVRFYKGAGNTGSHTGNLWTQGGTLLASATFANETATGWQQVDFATPVAVTAGTVYVASYHAPNGGYSANIGYFATSGVDAGPVNLLQDGISGGNGLYGYSETSAFPSSSYNASNYWVDVVFTSDGSGPPADTDPPLVTGVTPLDGSANAGTATAVTASLNEPLDATTVNGSTFELRDASGPLVTATVTYDAGSSTATLTPASALTPLATYTATLQGGAGGVADTSGNTLAADVSWTFTTSDGESSTAFDASATPQLLSANDSNGVELGVKFTVDTDGYIAGVRFYKGAGNTGSHTGNLWTQGGTLLASATFANETATGWQQVDFATPVAVTAGTVYVASYHAPNGGYSANIGYFATSGVDAGPVNLLQDGISGGNGLYGYSETSAFPGSSYNASNYWVDVVFTSDGSGPPADTDPPLVTGVTPLDGSANAGTATAVTASLNEPLDATTVNGSTFELRDASGPLVTATVTYDAGSSTATLTPASALTPLATYTATLQGGAGGVADTSGNTLAADVSWTFTTSDGESSTAFDASATPQLLSANDSNGVELGVKFTVDTDGYIAGVRFYKGAGNTGSHTGNLWTQGGTLLASATFANETATGWQQVDFATPVAVTAGTVYVASYHAPNGGYSANIGYFATSGVDAGPVNLLQDGISGGNGLYGYSETSAFPSSSYNASNYWVDVVFTTN